MAFEPSKHKILSRGLDGLTNLQNDELRGRWMGNIGSKGVPMKQNWYPRRWEGEQSFDQSSFQAVLQNLGYEIYEVKPYQHVWSGEANIEKTLSLNKKKICEKREKYDEYMDDIGKASENLLASFNVTKRKIHSSSGIYSGLRHADTPYQGQEMVDPWAESEMYPTRYKSTYQDYLQNRKWDDFIRGLENTLYTSNAADAWADQYGYYSKPISTDSYASLDSQGYENTSTENFSSGGMDEVTIRA